MEILIYQIVIFSIIVAASVIKGERGCKIASIVAVVWTLFHIIMPWLMAIQLLTVYMGFVVGMRINRSDSKQ